MPDAPATRIILIDLYRLPKKTNAFSLLPRLISARRVFRIPACTSMASLADFFSRGTCPAPDVNPDKPARGDFFLVREKVREA